MHVAVTDHRILRRPADNPLHQQESTASGALAAWVEPPVEARRRDLALANLTVGLRPGRQVLEQTGLDLLAALPPTERRQDAILAAECGAMLSLKAREAVDVCRRAAERIPESADRAMALGTALERAGDLAAAEKALRKAIEIDPSLKHAYAELWTVYDRQNKIQEMKQLADRFLAWNPRNVMFRILKADISAESGPARRP